jgi:hypothetical protein
MGERDGSPNPARLENFLERSKIRASWVSANDRADGVERESSGTMLWKPCVVPRRRSYGMTTPHTLTDTAHTTEEPFFNLNRIKTLLSRKGAPLMWPSRNCVVFTCNSEHYDNAGRLQHENPAKFFC